MNKILIIVAILLSLTSQLSAQNKESDVTKAVNALQDQIIKYEAEEGQIMMKINEIDTHIEKQLNTLFKQLIRAKDSGQTGSKVIRNKKKIIGDLQKAQKIYKNERKKIDQNFKTNTKLVGHDIYSLKKFMDDKVNERIKQITKVTDSLATYKEYYDWHGRYTERKNVETADREKNRVIKDFEKEIDELNKRAKKIDDGFGDSYSKERMINTYSEMQTINERVNLLEHSIEDILNGGNDGKKISRVAELRLDKAVRQTSAEVSGSFKSFLYALASYQRVLAKRKDLTARVNNIKKALNK
ncbi:MAG: hypothetical protein NE328_00590 [Lentisphaeraceae bacterium]|nr:hypothetical protein [Lentisphaeraceae bacterium]